MLIFKFVHLFHSWRDWLSNLTALVEGDLHQYLYMLFSVSDSIRTVIAAIYIYIYFFILNTECVYGFSGPWCPNVYIHSGVASDLGELGLVP